MALRAYRKQEVVDFVKARSQVNPEFWNTKLILEAIPDTPERGQKRKKKQKAEKKKGKHTHKNTVHVGGTFMTFDGTLSVISSTFGTFWYVPLQMRE